jgi:hypothetical protein
VSAGFSTESWSEVAEKTLALTTYLFVKYISQVRNATAIHRTIRASPTHRHAVAEKMAHAIRRQHFALLVPIIRKNIKQTLQEEFVP